MNICITGSDRMSISLIAFLKKTLRFSRRLTDTSCLSMQKKPSRTSRIMCFRDMCLPWSCISKQTREIGSFLLMNDPKTGKKAYIGLRVHTAHDSPAYAYTGASWLNYPCPGGHSKTDGQRLEVQNSGGAAGAASLYDKACAVDTLITKFSNIFWREKYEKHEADRC